MLAMRTDLVIKKKQNGITIIEVLVAMLILSVGLLGMASLQVRAVSDTTNSSFRSIAIYYANDMAERMRANGSALFTGAYNNHTGGAEKTACLTVGGCSAADMAVHDKWEWQDNISDALPAGRGEISQAAGIYTISVFWSDRVEQENADGDRIGTDETSVNFVFQP
jgi:type IV pilus assembly protein PilV